MYMQPDMKDNADNISNTCQREKKKTNWPLQYSHATSEMIPATGNPNPEKKDRIVEIRDGLQ